MSNDLIKLGPTASFSDVQLQGSRVKTLGKCKWEQAKQQAQLLATVDLSIQKIPLFFFTIWPFFKKIYVQPPGGRKMIFGSRGASEVMAPR
jgi:hypothetical protein